MIFTSIDFLIFLGCVLPAYWLIRSHWLRKAILIAASLYFYAYWDIRFVPLLVLVAVIVWFAARTWPGFKISRNWMIALAITAMLIILGVFKYAGFFASSLSSAILYLGIANTPLPNPGIILPVGISFFTFQGISYLVDVRRGHVKSHGLVDVLLYIALFPQLVAGPIVRASDFFPQLVTMRRFDAAATLEGVRLFLLGLVYKAVLANNVARLIDPIWADVTSASNADLATVAVGFYAQIYFDFNGYSLMAIGVAAMFGFVIPPNFNYPYLAVSLSDFWRRWHISLSSWLRDYLYIPLGGSRGSWLIESRNLMITMLLGGLWHGASWNFLIWGGLHGFGLMLERLWRSAGISQPHSIFGGKYSVLLLGWVWTQAVVFLLWVPFRAESASDTFTVLSAIFGSRYSDAASLLPWWFAPALLAVLLTDAVMGMLRNLYGANAMFARGYIVALLVGLLLGLLPLFIPLEVQPFIYFQF